MLIAQAAFGAWTLGQLAIFIIVVLAIFGIAAVVIRMMGVEISPDIRRIAMIVLVAFVGIVAILFLLRIAGMA